MRQVLCIMAMVVWIGGAGALAAGSVGCIVELAPALSGPVFGFDGSSIVAYGDYAWGEIGETGRPGGAAGSRFGENGSSICGTVCLPIPAMGEGTIDIGVYHKTDLVIDWPVGTWALLADASFSSRTSRMESFAATANVTAYGVSTTATFSLINQGAGPLSGLTFALAGTALSGMGVSLEASFGDPLGSSGSSSCEFDFRSLVLGLEGVPWGCFHTDADLMFGTHGFEWTEIDIDLELVDSLLTFDGTLWFEADQKRLDFIPRLNLNQRQCIWFNIEIEPQTIGVGKANLIDSLVVRGFGVTTCDVGLAEFSVVSTLEGGLYRLTRSTDLDLHATDYYIALDPAIHTGQYVQTGHRMVWTAAWGFANSEWIIDVYFDTGCAALFDLALLTAEWTQQMDSGFDIRLAMQIDSAGLSHRLEFGIAIESLLP